MARIAGVDIPREKRVEVALTYIYGIGRPARSSSRRTSMATPRPRPHRGAGQPPPRLIDKRFKVEGDLRRETALNIKRLRRSARTGASAIGGTSVPRPANEDQRAPAARPKRTVGARRKATK